MKFWISNCQSLMTFKLQKQQFCIITAQDKRKGTQKLWKISEQTVLLGINYNLQLKIRQKFWFLDFLYILCY